MNEIAKKSLKSRQLTLLLIGGLVLINAAIFFSFDVSQIHLMQWIYTLNPRCWPDWYCWNLWLLVGGAGAYQIFNQLEKKKTAKTILMLDFLLIGIIVFTFSFFCKMLRLQVYYVLTWFLDIPYTWFYKPLIYVPLTEFSATGTVSWKLFILPLLGIFGILFLIRLGKKQRQKKTALKRGES